MKKAIRIARIFINRNPFDAVWFAVMCGMLVGMLLSVQVIDEVFGKICQNTAPGVFVCKFKD